jgi:hypothetical protein
MDVFPIALCYRPLKARTLLPAEAVFGWPFLEAIAGPAGEAGCGAGAVSAGAVPSIRPLRPASPACAIRRMTPSSALAHASVGFLPEGYSPLNRRVRWWSRS